MSEQRTPNDQILQFFGYQHLPEHLQAISRPFHDTAHWIHQNLPPSAERSTCLRKLLEAKDCAVRCMVLK